VLDLFAGTGALGIEALSRGAQSAVFIDISRQALSVLGENLADLCLESPNRVIRWDLTQNLNCLLSMPQAFDLVFLDPPYNKNLIIPALDYLHLSQSLDNGARLFHFLIMWYEGHQLRILDFGFMEFKISDLITVSLFILASSDLSCPLPDRAGSQKALDSGSSPE
jgi:tRNA G10  N-methylase Trm11